MGGGGCETVTHSLGEIYALCGDDGSLFGVLGVDSYGLIRVLQIQQGIVLFALKGLEKAADIGQGKAVLDGV